MLPLSVLWLVSSAGAITQFYPDSSTPSQWNSNHWATGSSRSLASKVGKYDPTDPTGWSQVRGSGKPVLTITGDGRMKMSGRQPRMYINTYGGSNNNRSQAEHLFENVEFTGYFRRLSSDGAAYGGFLVGLRSGPQGHGARAGDDCEATTYYSRLRNDGRWQFVKELKHPKASVVKTVNVWDGDMPLNTWIGMKYVVYTRPDGSVQLKAWLDHTGGVNGGDWKLVGSFIDDGSWSAKADWGSVDASGCSYNEDYVIAPGNGVAFIRNTKGKGEYKWITVREIAVGSAPPSNEQGQGRTA